MTALPFLGMFALLIASAFFSAVETAYNCANGLRLKKAAEQGDKAALCAKRVLDNYDLFLSTILVLNNMANIAASSLCTVIAMSLWGDASVSAASLVLTVVILIFGEITPKILAKGRADAFARFASAPMTVFIAILRPFVFAAVKFVDVLSRLWGEDGDEPTITEEEFAEILNTVEDEGVIDEDTGDLLQSALEFDEVTSEMAMTPRVEMIAVDLDDPRGEILKTVLDAGYSRIPAYRDTIDRIVGVLPVNQYLLRVASGDDPDPAGMLMEPLRIHKTMKLDDALRLMRKARNHIAVVMDEYGGTLGILTMEDVLEQLVGEIWDESDDIVEEIKPLGEGVWEVLGTTSLHDFCDETDFDERLIDSEYATVGGWTVEMLEEQPGKGKSFTFRNLKITVLEMDGLRVSKLLAEMTPEDQSGEA